MNNVLAVLWEARLIGVVLGIFAVWLAVTAFGPAARCYQKRGKST